MDAQAILHLLEETDIPFVQLILRKRASIKGLRAALRITQVASARRVLCDVLGFRYARSALPELLMCVGDDSEAVRCSAADAVGKIGDERAGETLLRQLLVEQSLPAKRALAMAFDCVPYLPAIPALIDCLSDQDASLRGCAALSLGKLAAAEAYESLIAAVKHEAEGWPKWKMKEAIQAIEKQAASTPPEIIS